MENDRNSEARWFDPRKRGTIANFTAKVAIVGVMLGVITDRTVDQSKGAVDDVVGNRTEQIRDDIQEPMSQVEDNAKTAVEKIDRIEENVDALREWFQDNLGVDFSEAANED